jgi:quercetin dioxygenase-like cupin family protein
MTTSASSQTPAAFTQRTLISLQEVMGSHPEERWSEKVVLDGRNRAAMICSPAGTPGDPHLHPDYNEWWVILNDEVEYQIGEYEPITAKFGDVVIAPCGFRHDIRPSKGEKCIRLVVGFQHSNHDLKGVAPSRQIPIDDLAPPNRIHTPLEYMLERHGTDKSWSEEVLLDQRNRANLIHQMPGQGNRPHWHPDMDEWWVVMKGELEWRVGNDAPLRAKKGDIVFVAAGRSHAIDTIGDESSIRLAVTSPDVVHIYLDDPDAPRPPNE